MGLKALSFMDHKRVVAAFTVHYESMYMYPFLISTNSLLLFLIWNSFSQKALNRRRRLWYNEIGKIWNKAVRTNVMAST
jgi:hypothetical protein